MPIKLGVVITTDKSPTPSLFHFVITNKNQAVHKHQFVQLQTDEGTLVARVSNVLNLNRYFENPEAVRAYETTDSMENSFPVKKWEYKVAEAIPLGIIVSGMQKRVSVPPSPGSEVFNAKNELLQQFLGLDPNGLLLGKIAFHDVDARFNMVKLLQKHVAILSISGGGKSHTTTVLIEELLERDGLTPAIIVIDPHGEYTGFGDDERYMSKTRVFNRESIKIGASSLTPNQILEFLPQMTSVQRRDLGKLISELREERKEYGIDDIIQKIESSKIEERTKRAMLRWMDDLKRTGLIGNVDEPGMEELVRIGGLSVIDLSDIVDLRKKQIIVAHLARKLFEARRLKLIPPFVLIVEEAHQFAPEGVERERAISRNIIETMAREGRKFSASLILISQRPIKLSTTALSQCNTQIILRVTNPYDIKHIGESAEGITQDVLDMIPGLKVGEALVIGEAVNYPILIKVRERKSKKKEELGDMEKALEEFVENKKRTEEDLEAFM
ncbi:MAG: ATP-binding protein [Candidatus Aenigmarchaeota archaeon]|nr:ATP-binding protein [Candidatus Aenigmarchaeota archaeon]